MSILEKGIIIACMVVGGICTATSVFGIESNTVSEYPYNILKARANKIQQVSSSGEKERAISVDSQITTDMSQAKSSASTWYGDFFSDLDGFEKVQVRKRRVRIYNQEGDRIMQFKPGPKKTERVLTVADLDSTNDGLEIITCQTNSRRPRLKMFSIDPATLEKTKLFGTTVFADELTTNKAFGGCEGIEVGDIDKDGEQEIVVVKAADRHHTVDTVVYFDSEGNQEGEISLQRTYWGLNNPMQTMDIDGDGYNDEFVLEGTVYDSDGSVLHEVYGGDCRYSDFAFADVDQDGADELVTMTGKKGKICVYDSHFQLEDSFVLYPNVRSRRYRKLILIDVSELLTNV